MSRTIRRKPYMSEIDSKRQFANGMDGRKEAGRELAFSRLILSRTIRRKPYMSEIDSKRQFANGMDGVK